MSSTLDSFVTEGIPEDMARRLRVLGNKTVAEIAVKEYNEKGKDVMIMLQRWENNLCAKSESSKYGKFSDKLADKFWGEIRTIFPKIDFVGMQTK